MSIKSKVLSALSWTASARFAGQFATWAITIYVIRILSPDDYGLISMATVMIGFAFLINELGVIPAFIQSDEITDYHVRQIFGVVLISNGLVYVAVLGAAPYFAMFFEDDRLTQIIRVLATSLLIAAPSAVPTAMLQREIRFKGLSIVEFCSMIAGSVVTLAFALSDHGVWSLVFGNLAMATTKSVGVLVVTRFAVLPTFRFHGLGHFFSFGAKISGQKILWYVRSQIDVILVGKLLGNEALGVYSVALNLARLPITKVAALVNQVAFPSYSRLQNEPEKAAGYFFTSVQLGAFITFPLFWGMSSVAPEIVDVLLGERWREATIVLQLLTVVMPLQFLSLLLFPLIDGLGHPGVSLRNITTSFVILTLALVAGIYWGLTGLCIGFVLGTGLSFIINFHRSMPLIDSDMSSLSRAVAPSLVSAAVMYVIVVASKTFLLADADGPVRLVVPILIGAVAFGAMTLTVNRRVVHDSVAIVRVRA